MSNFYELNKSISLEQLSSANNLVFDGKNVAIAAISTSLKEHSNSLAFMPEFSASASENVAVATSIIDKSLLVNNGLILTDNPRLCFVKILSYIVKTIGIKYPNKPTKISKTAVISRGVVIENDCIIEDNVVIEPNVTIHRGTHIGKGSRVRSGASIGSDGFGFERDENGIPIRFEHLGGVLIGSHVEIGSNATIARGTLGDTVIEKHVKIDNLVHIAHNAKICEGALITACAEISGGVVVGKNAWIAPNSCTHQKINIGEASLVGLGAVVVKDVEEKTIVAGNPAKIIRRID